MKMLGDYWVLSIIGALRTGEKRYTELQREIESINTATLSNRLVRLYEYGMVARKELSRADVTYSLTERGKLVVPILDAINDFSRTYDALSIDAPR